MGKPSAIPARGEAHRADAEAVERGGAGGADRAVCGRFGANPVLVARGVPARRNTQALAGRSADRAQAKVVTEIKSAPVERDQVVGELTITNRFL